MFERLIEKYKPAPIKVKFFDSKNRVVSAISKSKSFEVFLGRKKIIQRSYYPEGLNTWQKHDLVGFILFEIEMEVYNKWVDFVEKESRGFAAKLKKIVSQEKIEKRVTKKFINLVSAKGIKYKKPYFVKKVKSSSKLYKKEYSTYEVLAPKFMPKHKSGDVFSMRVDFAKSQKIDLVANNFDLVWQDFAIQASPHIDTFLKKSPNKKRVSAYLIIFVKPFSKETSLLRGRKDHTAISFPSSRIEDLTSAKTYYEDLLNETMFFDNLRKYISIGQTSGYTIEGFEARITYETKDRDEIMAEKILTEAKATARKTKKFEYGEVMHKTRMEIDPKYRKQYKEDVKRKKRKLDKIKKSLVEARKKKKKKSSKAISIIKDLK